MYKKMVEDDEMDNKISDNNVPLPKAFIKLGKSKYMYNYIKNGEIRLKSVLFKVIDENVALFSYYKEKVLQILYKHYHPKDNIDITHLEQYTKLFANYFDAKCKNIAKHCSDNVNTHNKQEITTMENNGKLFKSGIFNTIKRHLYLEKRLLNANNQIAISIITTLSNHLGNLYLNISNIINVISKKSCCT